MNQNPWTHIVSDLQADVRNRIQKGNKIGIASQRQGRSASHQPHDASHDNPLPQLELPNLLSLVSPIMKVDAGTPPVVVMELHPVSTGSFWSNIAKDARDGIEGQHIKVRMDSNREHETSLRPNKIALPNPLRTLGPAKVEMLSTTVPPSPKTDRSIAPHNTPVKLFEQQPQELVRPEQIRVFHQHEIIRHELQPPLVMQLHNVPCERGSFGHVDVNAQASANDGIMNGHPMDPAPRLFLSTSGHMDSGLPRFLV